MDIEKCNDNHPSGNGYDVGWTSDNEWLQFTIHSDSTAAYPVQFRSASLSDPAIVYLMVNGTDVSPFHQLPATGGWQTWQTSMIDDVIIPAGENKIRLHFYQGGSNVSFFQFTNPVPVSAVPFGFISASTNSEGTSVVLTLNKSITGSTATAADFEVRADGNPNEIDTVQMNPGNGMQLLIRLNHKIRYGQSVTLSYSGNSVVSDQQSLENFADKPVKNNLPRRFVLPVLIQAEDFDFNYGFQLETCTDAGGGENVDFANNGDYLDYYISVPVAGEYIIKFRVASLYSNGSISIRPGSGNSFNQLRTVQFSGTGGWQSWTTQSLHCQVLLIH